MKNFIITLLLLTFCLSFVEPSLAADYCDPATATLAWDAPTDGGPVTGYNVKVGTTSGTYTITSTTTSTTLALSALSLTQGKAYYAVVTAYNAAGEGAASNEISFTPLAVPGVPVFRVQK